VNSRQIEEHPQIVLQIIICEQIIRLILIGACINDEEMIQIVNLAKKYNCFLFSDEMYFHLGSQTKSAIDLYSDLSFFFLFKDALRLL
jgi:hypothetical protein